jgi:orotidine 5''-phosphate decarboxylase, subfamily 1
MNNIDDRKVLEAARCIIFALDVNSADEAREMVRKIPPSISYVKVGLALISAQEAGIVAKMLQAIGKEVFWDGKFADIPNTVAKATSNAARFDVSMINVHASSGMEAIKAAVANRGSSFILGVTILTSIDETECVSIFGNKPNAKVIQFARMLLQADVHGIICSPKEVELLGKYREFDKLLKITPGVRPEWASAGDQKRVMTPREAIEAGATHLVIGRPISSPPPEIGSPEKAAAMIIGEIAEALAQRR